MLTLLFALQSIDARAQEANVIAVRPQGIVVDAAQLEDLKPGVKVGFVRDGAERQEIAQGWVLELKAGKALVGAPPGSGVKKGDLMVVCPAAGEDRHAELRAKLEEFGETTPAPKGRKPSRAQQVVQQVTEALEARDAAAEEGKCDLASHDEQIETLGEQLSKVAASRPPARREASRAPAKSRAPTKKPAEEEEPAEEPAEEDTASAQRKPDEATPSTRDSAREDPATARETKQAPALQTAIDAVLKLIEGGSQKSGKRDRKRLSDDTASTPSESPSDTEPVVRAMVPPAAPAEAPASDSTAVETPKATPPATSGSSASSPSVPPRRGGGPVADPAPPPPSGGTSTAQGGTSPAPPTDRQTDRGGRIPGSRVPLDRTAPSKETPSTSREPSEGRQPGVKFPDKIAKLPTPSKEDPRTATISGRVVSDKGEPVAGARVTIVGGSPKATTTEQGTFELKNLTPGGYKLVVSAPGFSAETRAVNVAAGKSESVTFSLKASADRLGATPGIKRPRKFGGDADE